MGEEVKQVVASLGYERAQDLVGRYDLLEQVAHHDTVDLAPLITPLEEFLDLEPIDLPVAESEDQRAEAGMVVARPIRMEAKQASTQIAGLAGDICSGRTIRNEFPRATDANDRVLGSELSGAIARSRIFEDGPESNDDVLASLEFNGGSVAGQGLGAFNSYGVAIRIEGGAQDGVGKTMLGGSIAVLKGKGAKGQRVNGSVGKSFAYGAQRGRLFVQGSADSRFCIRLSGADVVLAGEPRRGDRRQPRLHRRPRQRQGLRLRVHDLGPRDRARRPRPLGLRRDDRRPRLRPPQRLRHRPRGDRAPAGRGRQGRAERARRRGPARHRRPARQLTPANCGRPARTRRPTA